MKETEMGEKRQTKRLANIEALRVLAMMMVVSLHYLGKGEILGDAARPFSPHDYAAWLLESFSIAAVDVYVLISGYFLVEMKFRLKRVISIVLQVLFYSCLIPVILAAAGILPVNELTLYDIWQYIFPIHMKHYWFLSAYVLLLFFTPVLNAAVHAMKKEQLGAVIILLLLAESFGKSIIPARLALDNEGYDTLWFIVVYLVAAYSRLYGIAFLEKKNRAAVCYVFTCFGIYGLMLSIRAVSLYTGRFKDFVKSPYAYNHLLAIGAAIALFYMFKNIKSGEADSLFMVFIRKISPYTLGVYLLHEHLNVRYEWPFLLGADQCNSVISLLGHWLLAIIIVMACGITVDYCRSILFRHAGKLFAGGRLDHMLRKIDERINGLWAV